ncbi:MAG: LysM peptidoglycan-binding domain-containing protein [Bacteroidetes bacterium]|nr:LysM peptidoglycan-binding domain-containing protein [Bacteroidota bacterium]
MKRIFALLFLSLALQLANAQEAIPQFLKHTVRSGETLGDIAVKYKINKRDILLLNDFPDNKKVKAGEVVLIKTLTEKEANEADKAMYAQPKKQVAKQTEEVSQPAKAAVKSEAPVQTKTAKQPVKETFAEPVQKSVTPPPPSTKAVEVGPGGTKYSVATDGYHTVQRGQTFYRVALIYGLTVEELQKINNLPNTNIEVGQKLKVKK